MTELSIVIGTLNRLSYLQVAIESIARETKRPYRVFVTDAGSTDGTINYLQSIASDTIRPVLVGRKLGQAKAYNDVFETIDTPYVCWLSDDNEVVNGGLDTALRILDAEPGIGMVGLKVRDTQGPFAASPYVGGVSKLGILNVNQGVLRTHVLQDVGYFSRAFRDYGIDPDLTAKVLLAGHEVVYTREIAIHHHRLWPEDEKSAEHLALKKKHDRFFQLYLMKYSSLNRFGLWWKAKKAAWVLSNRILPSRMNINRRSPVMGHLPRDWHNILASRFIGLRELLQARDSDFHLRQRIPEWFRRAVDIDYLAEPEDRQDYSGETASAPTT